MEFEAVIWRGIWTGATKGAAWGVALLAVVVLWASEPWFVAAPGTAALAWLLAKLPGPA